jgi:hypothetical protein
MFMAIALASVPAWAPVSLSAIVAALLVLVMVLA